MIGKFPDPTDRPGLAYQHAFDWLVVRLLSSPGPRAAKLNTSFHGLEVLQRCPDISLLEPLPVGLAESANSYGIGQIKTMPVPHEKKLAAVAWIEPGVNVDLFPEQLLDALLPGGFLFLISPGRFARFLAENRLNGRLKQQASTADIENYLEQNGFRIQERLALHGLRPIIWHSASQIAGWFKQKHLRDRAHYAFRRDFCLPTREHWAALHLIAAERAS